MSWLWYQRKNLSKSKRKNHLKTNASADPMRFVIPKFSLINSSKVHVNISDFLQHDFKYKVRELNSKQSPLGRHDYVEHGHG